MTLELDISHDGGHMEILDLAKFLVTPDQVFRSESLLLGPPQLEIDFKTASKISIRAHVRAPQNNQPKRIAVSLDLDHNETDRSGVSFQVPIDAFPDFGIDAKASAHAFKLGKFSVLDFAFSIMAKNHARVRINKAPTNVIEFFLQLGDYQKRLLVYLDDNESLCKALGLSSP